MRETPSLPPDYYGIEYEINPWMSERAGAEAPVAQEQWRGLTRPFPNWIAKLSSSLRNQSCGHVFAGERRTRCSVTFIPRQLSAQRARWRSAGILPAGWKNAFSRFLVGPNDYYFEGEGDALFAGDILLRLIKFRSDIKSHRAVGGDARCLVVSVELVIRAFIISTLVFGPLTDGAAVWFRPRSTNTVSTAIREPRFRSGSTSRRTSDAFLLQRRRD